VQGRCPRGGVRRDLATAWLLQLLGRVRAGEAFCFDSNNEQCVEQWLSRLPKLSCNLAGESWHFDWLGSARLCEPEPKAWLGSAHKPDRLRVAQLWLAPASRASQHYGGAAKRFGKRSKSLGTSLRAAGGCMAAAATGDRLQTMYSGDG